MNTSALPSSNGPAPHAPIPQSKTDKPRPHVCTTCSRSFARLEHLKRHERSHTKEKPFECQECTRRFARRDLLLRHQQKLHMSTTPAARPRSGRRESTSSSMTGGSARVRKNSTASTSGWMRPRANTIGHVDGNQLGLLVAVNSAAAHGGGVDRPFEHPENINGFHDFNGMDYRGMEDMQAAHGMPPRAPRGLAKLETRGLPLDLGGNLRTAPPFPQYPSELHYDGSFGPQGNTVNPAQLHFIDSPSSYHFETPSSPYPHGFGMDSGLVEEEPAFDWVRGYQDSMSMVDVHEHAIGSSPSADSSGSPDIPSEVMPDVPSDLGHTTRPWQSSLFSQEPLMTDYPMGAAVTFPTSMAPQFAPAGMEYASGEPPFSLPSSAAIPEHEMLSLPPFSYGLHPPLVLHPDSPTTAHSVQSSNRQSSATSFSTDSISDATRSSLMASFAPPATQIRHGPPLGSNSPLASGHTTQV